MELGDLINGLVNLLVGFNKNMEKKARKIAHDDRLPKDKRAEYEAKADELRDMREEYERKKEEYERRQR